MMILVNRPSQGSVHPFISILVTSRAHYTFFYDRGQSVRARLPTGVDRFQSVSCQLVSVSEKQGNAVQRPWIDCKRQVNDLTIIKICFRNEGGGGQCTMLCVD